METILSVLVGLGLSAACGFRVFIPPLIISLAAASGHLSLSEGFAWMGTTPALVAFSCAAFVEILAFYIPWVDNALDTVATPAAVISGTVLSASMITDMEPFLRWTLAIIAGGSVAGLVQAATVALRGLSTSTTGGIANPVLSTAELGGSVMTTIGALLTPILLALAGLFVLAVVAAVIIWRIRARRNLNAQTPVDPDVPPAASLHTL